MLTTWALKFRGLKKRIAWHLYQRRDLQSAHVLHATSRDEADGFRALGLTQPIAIVPNGVELPEIRGQRSEIRDRKLTSDPPPSELTSDLRPLTSGIPAPGSSLPARTALFLSRIHPKKGLFDLVAAWGLVRPKGWRVVIAGGSENGHQADLESAIRERGLGDEFQFLGEVPDDRKWGVYRSADLFILPTKSENFGIVIAEALGSGVPVITTKGTPWEELQTHRCGWWVDPNAEALAGALREACALSPEERSAMGERGRKLIESKYTWPAAAAQMLAVYRWMLSKGERPECVV
jgi:glycosyltransferase involved in cell wall biosynthesis